MVVHQFVEKEEMNLHNSSSIKFHFSNLNKGIMSCDTSNNNDFVNNFKVFNYRSNLPFLRRHQAREGRTTWVVNFATSSKLRHYSRGCQSCLPHGGHATNDFLPTLHWHSPPFSPLTLINHQPSQVNRPSPTIFSQSLTNHRQPSNHKATTEAQPSEALPPDPFKAFLRVKQATLVLMTGTLHLLWIRS